MSNPLQSFFMELLPHLQGSDRDRHMHISVSRPTFFSNGDDIIMGNLPHMPATMRGGAGAGREDNGGDSGNGSSSSNSSNSATGHVYNGDIPPILWIQREQQRIQSIPTNISSNVNDAPVAESQRLRQQGNTAFNAGNYTEALRLYTEAITADPTETVNYTNRSFTYFKMGEFDLSAKDAEKAIECSPQFYKAHYRLGLAQLARGEYTQALSSLRKAATFAPLNVKDEIRVAIAKCESKVARTPVTPLLTDNSSAHTTQRSAFGSFTDGNTTTATRSTSDAARAGMQYHALQRDSTSQANFMYDGVQGESGSRRESMGEGGGSDGEAGRETSHRIPDFYSMAPILNEVMSIREDVRAYHVRYAQQAEIAECRHRAQTIRQLLSIANSGKLPQLTQAAEEAQTALRRTLKSENRSVYYEAKKERDEALQRLWSTAHEMRAAINKLKTIAKEENIFLQRFLSPSPEMLTEAAPAAAVSPTAAESLAPPPPPSATAPHLSGGDRSDASEADRSSSSLVSVRTPPPEEQQQTTTTPPSPPLMTQQERDHYQRAASQASSHTKQHTDTPSRPAPHTRAGADSPASRSLSPATVQLSSGGHPDTHDAPHNLIMNSSGEDRHELGPAGPSAMEKTPAESVMDSTATTTTTTTSVMTRRDEDTSRADRKLGDDDVPHRRDSARPSQHSVSSAKSNGGVGSSSSSSAVVAAAATTDAHFDQLLHRREEIDEHVRKAQRCCAATDAAGQAFLCALREEQEMIQSLRPLLSEAESLNAGLEAHARSVAHSTYRELTAPRLEALDTVRAHAERIQTDENAFCASAAEGDRLLETEAELERERLMYERQRIKVQAEVEWLKVRDMPEHRITALQNHVKILQQKASDINLRQRGVQERILAVINADHPEIAWKSLALGSRIVSLVKGSGLWLNLSFSDFQILSTLSSTVNSKVYHAVRRGEHVALKEIPIDAELERRRFQREVDIVAGCSHPNIIRIKGVFFDGPFAYLLMPYYHRGSAKTLLTKRTPQPWIYFQDMFRQIATALAYLHERGIVHGDIKPSNVLLSDDGRPVISDFGIAKNYGRFGELADVTMTTTNHSSAATLSAVGGGGESGAVGSAGRTHAAMAVTSRGTMNYMAPEQLRGDVVTPTPAPASASSSSVESGQWNSGADGAGATGLSDIWAFGVSMYELAASNSAALDEAVPHNNGTNSGSNTSNSTTPTMASSNSHSNTATTTTTTISSNGSYEFVLPVITPEMRRVEVPARRVGGSAKLADLISSALVVDPARRSTAYEMLAHPYFSTACNAREDGAAGGLGSDTLLRSDERLEAVRSYIHAVRRGQDQEQKVLVSVSRLKMVESLQEIFSRLSESAMLSPIMVVFQGEAGIDEGALTTEMLNLFYEQLVRSHGALRCASSCGGGGGAGGSDGGSSINNNTNTNNGWPGEESDGSGGSRGTYNFGTATYLPAEDGGVCYIPESMFELTGKVLLKNIIENRPLPLRLNPAVVKYFCGVEPSMLDLEEYDSTLSDNLKRLLLLSKEDLLVADLDFSHFSASFLAEHHDGQYTRDTTVNPGNVRTYVALRVLYDMTAKRAVALEAMKKGFYSIRSLNIHLKLLSPFDLLMLLCGVQHISAQMVVHALEFHSFPRSSHTPRYLREILLQLTQNNLRRFLLLCTSSPALPASNAMKKIKVVRGADVHRLPVGHGCVSQLDLPDYNDKKILNDKLQVALAHVSDGFHVV